MSKPMDFEVGESVERLYRAYCYTQCKRRHLKLKSVSAGSRGRLTARTRTRFLLWQRNGVGGQAGEAKFTIHGHSTPSLPLTTTI